MDNLIEIQAFDVLLKRFCYEKSVAKDKNFKVVLEVDKRLWSGDLIHWNSNSISELYIDEIGEVERLFYHKENSPFVNKIFIAANEYIKKNDNHLRKIEDPRLIFNMFRKIVQMIDFSDVDSEIDQVLYNASSLTDSVELPFLSLKNSDVKLVAIKGNDH